MKKMFSAFLLLMLLISCTKSNANKYAGVWVGDLGNIIGMAMTVNDENTVSLPIGSSPVIISNVQAIYNRKLFIQTGNRRSNGSIKFYNNYDYNF